MEEFYPGKSAGGQRTDTMDRPLDTTTSTFLSLFAEQVSRCPDAIALVSEESMFTYHALEQYSCRLARYIVQTRRDPEQLIGLCLPRGPHLIVALLAVLKAGNAYVPLDMEMPVERLRYVIGDAGLSLVLTCSEAPLNSLGGSLTKFLGEGTTSGEAAIKGEEGETTLVLLDQQWSTIMSEDIDVPLDAIDQRQAAYVIYTSGSTGRPKGVVVEHCQLNQYIQAVIARLEMVPGERAALLQSLVADFGLTILYPTLSLGGTLHLVSQECASDPDALGCYVQAYAIDLLKITPSHWAALHGVQLERALLPARALIFGGEALRWSQVQAIYDCAPSLSVYNHYGPTETTVGCLAWRIAPEAQDLDVSLVPLGFPLSGERVFILDERQVPLQAGERGEIYIGGAGVARGYLQRAELTSERFIPDPFTGSRGGRLYRTGDQGRLRADGLFEYLGRLDDQVKIRGYRVELGEVTTVLAAHEGIREAAVLALEDEGGELQLAAYIVPHSAWTLSAAALRAWMQERVPGYLVPVTFTFLSQMPLLSNGKINRRALPVPERQVAETGLIAPRTRIEETVLQIWQQVFGQGRSGIHSIHGVQVNFFDIGGHSLLAMRILARIRRELKVDVALDTLFSYPTIAQLAAYIEEVQPTQVVDRLPLVSVRERPAHLPLSHGQSFLWFFYQLEPESPYYTIPLALHLRNHVHLHALEKSLQAIVQRHESLRTIIVQSSEGLEQMILPAPDVRVPIIDLQGLLPAQQEAELQVLMQQEAAHPFRIEKELLFRTWLLRLNENEHVLLLTFHHSIFDGWSQHLLLQELSACYQYFTAEEETVFPLAPLAIQYADYTLWQERWLQTEQSSAQLSYWRKQLAGAPTVLNLPTDHPRPPVRTYQGAVERFVLSPTLTSALKDLSRREGATLFMTLLAAFSTLLARYSGQREFLLGSPVAHRRHEELEQLMGFFVNTLVLRCDLNGQPGFNELLQRTRRTVLEAYANQDIPFERLVQELQVDRSANSNPLFQVLFVLQNARSSVTHMGEVEVTWLERHSATAKFDLLLDAIETDQGLQCKLEYSTDLFEPSTIRRMVIHFQALLEGIIVQPTCTIPYLPLITGEEQQQLKDWGAFPTLYPYDRCIHELFEEQVSLHPDAIALSCGNVQLSYSELDRSATALAHTLRAQGVGPEVMVGICYERSPEQIIALLAILKAGGCYVPVDPNYPSERLKYMFENAQLSLVLAQKALAGSLISLPASRLLWHEDLLEQDGRETIQLDNQAVPVNLAYVMYTSGSTGLPKGVSVTHQNVVRLVKETNYARLDEHEAILQYAPIAFDASTLEIWGSLLTGGRLVIAPPALASLSELASLLQQQAVTTAWLTAGLFHQMVEHHLNDLLGLRQILAGGDVLSVAHVRRLLVEAKGCMLINGYGPTENTTFTCCYPMRSSDDFTYSVPIGYPIANTSIYVLDEEMQSVPVGIYGELYIGGDGLARGYYQRPELTAERFVPHPLSSVPGERLYRTGDIVRFLPNGALEFLGRSDFQVKIRGFRIELGEIEVTLHEHPQVREAVVIVREDVPGNKQLTAYIVAQSGCQVEQDEIRGWLRQRVPDYMVPVRVLSLAQLPLSPNGKVDRKALPEPEDILNEQQVSPYQAQTVLEEILMAIWCQVLNIAHVGIHDTFFELGGHSLLATQVIARIRQHLGREVSLRSFMETPTIAHLAQQLENSDQQEEEREVMPALVSQPRPAHLPLSLAQQRLWFLCQLDPTNPFYNISLTVRLQGALVVEHLAEALNWLLARHEILRTSLHQELGEPFQRIAESCTLSLPFCCLSELAPVLQQQQLAELARAERARPFDLSVPPLFRALLVRLASDEHVLLLSVHHIILDGWSQQVLLDELATGYRAFSSNDPQILPGVPVLHYADYTLWQRAWLTEAVLEPHLRFWQQRLQDAPRVLELPTDFQRPAIQSFRGATVRGVLPDALALQVRQLARQQGSTLFMVLLSAFALLLARLSGQGQVVLGTPNANRRQVELERLLGFCVTTLLVPVDLRGTPTFLALLRQVRETLLQVTAHQDVPFDRLVELLHPDRSLSHTPLFQVGFGFWSQRGHQPDWGGVQMELLAMPSVAVKQDLMLDIVETSEGSFHLQWDYNVDLFTAKTIERWHESFTTLVQAACQTPERASSRLALLAPSEWNRLKTLGQGLQIPQPGILGGFQQRIWQQAVRNPEQPALMMGNETCSYGELTVQVQQLARQLRLRGVGPEVLVGLYLDRSMAVIIALLAVLEAGGGFVPLDVHYPQDRLAYMCQDSGIALLLTQPGLQERVPVANVPVLTLDAAGQPLTSPPVPAAGDVSEADQLPIHAGQVAYVIYTSGSTGRPKGVMVSHRGVASLIDAQVASLGSQQGKRILQFASLSFDASVWEVILALGQGGTLVLAPREQLLPGPALHDLLHQQRINTVTLSPSVLAALPAGRYPDLECIVTAGEACDGETVRQWSQGRAFFNAYGPTETTVCASIARCIPDGTRPPIGMPIVNLDLLVLDRSGEVVPQGVVGELCVGGLGLARGYLGRAEQTAERFVPHPWKAGERLYRTGDLVRWGVDGQLEYLGRGDQQVKLRGHRIELGEIEESLRADEQVEACAVVVRDDVAGGERGLVGYVVLRAGAEVSQVRQRLRERLPEYMVPGHLVQMERLPINANAKVDVKALPRPGADTGRQEHAGVEPATQLEREIAAVWCEVLQCERVSLHDNFFDLGGHSLLLTRLQKSFSERFEKAITLVELFQHTTVQAQAACFMQQLQVLDAPSSQTSGRVAARQRHLRQRQKL